FAEPLLYHSFDVFGIAVPKYKYLLMRLAHLPATHELLSHSNGQRPNSRHKNDLVVVVQSQLAEAPHVIANEIVVWSSLVPNLSDYYCQESVVLETLNALPKNV